MDPKELPIQEIRGRLAAAAGRGRRVAIVAPTGSGKSTQVPQMLVDGGLAGGGRVVVLQPRRIAARMLAARVAEERGGRLGGEVGYRVRLEGAESAETKILFETEGILLRRMLEDRGLAGVGAIVFDEFHERHVYGDLTLSEALRLQRERRPDLLLVAMSATLDIGALRPAFEPFETVESAGRTFPVEVEYLARPLDARREGIWDAAAAAYARVRRERGEETGDALVFMPGAYEIQRTIEALRAEPAARGAVVLPLHGELPAAEQDAAVGRTAGGARKIVVATNVAETSLTIEGVRTVIDSGLARVARFDPYRGIDTLLIENVSRASADQRAGRAGRTAPGLAVRLWTEREHAGRAAHDTPEILRVDPAEFVLILKEMGVADLKGYPWITAPTDKALERALGLLRDLGALGPDGRVTALGRQMLDFPMHPRHSRMLLAAAERGAVRPVALLAALAQSRPVFLRRTDRETLERRNDVLGGEECGSDLLLAMRAWRYAEQHRFDVQACGRLGIHAGAARTAGPLARRFLETAARRGLAVEEKPPEDAEIAKCVLAGFSDQVARRLDKGTLRCELVRGRRGELARNSAADGAELLVASEINEIGRLEGETQVRITQATRIEGAWLREMFPGDFEETTEAVWDAAAKRAEGRREVRFRGLALESRPAEAPAEAAAALLAEEVRKGEVALKGWDHAVEQWIERTNLLAKACPDWGIPAYDAEARAEIVRQVCHGARSAKEVRERPVAGVVRGWLSAAQQALVEKALPERVALSNGRTPKVQYAGGGDPFVALRIQEIFGVEELPKLAGGRVPLVIHILAPNQRPVQITRDLAGFWREHYPRVKKELARKYPKHKWP